MSIRLYDVKRGMNRVPQYQDAAWAAKHTFGFEGAKAMNRIFPNSSKDNSFQGAKAIFEANVGYKVDNAKFAALIRYAKFKGLLK